MTTSSSMLGPYTRFFIVAISCGLGLWVAFGPEKKFDSAPDAPMVSVNLQDLTWTEVARALSQGYHTVIVPTGGTEQNGPHVILGKHNYVIAATAELIAHELEDTLVAPVIAYVPQGDYGDAPTGHMQFPGTITVREDIFRGLLEDTARSFAAHGFTRIIFIGDSGWNQAAQQTVAQALSQEWVDRGIRVLHISDYYDANGQTEWLTGQGFSIGEIGAHAGIRDTSETLAVHPEGVRMQFVPAPVGSNAGYSGAPSVASKDIGEAMIALKVEAAVRQIVLTEK